MRCRGPGACPQAFKRLIETETAQKQRAALLDRLVGLCETCEDDKSGSIMPVWLSVIRPTLLGEFGSETVEVRAGWRCGTPNGLKQRWGMRRGCAGDARRKASYHVRLIWLAWLAFSVQENAGFVYEILSGIVSGRKLRRMVHATLTPPCPPVVSLTAK